MAKFAHFESDGRTAWGTVENNEIHELRGGLFDPLEPSGRRLKLSDVSLLAPCEPAKIIAVGLNYKSHLGDRKVPENPEIFYKPVSCLQNPDGPIVIPGDALDTHFEGELVVVIGKTVRNATREQAAEAVFGVTCGNDVSDRNWQRGAGKDVQWWRAKGCDTFGPLGPVIVTGLDYSDLALTTRVNGEVLQHQRTSDLIFDIPTIVSFVSRYLTLTQGDVIYTGTPGNTQRLKPGDVVEVEIEGIGILRNPVA
ncbi:MAG TPA: fumarylacetoacetate hydrolase family protein [Bryobacteraceae bacterium]|jgi:2-keto-4-pentenoate hydratase/2-oxohepta-3-ene-1,7-dioic acid hydratase in catechol pathway|nr:fumarylacetoacetate hydrolase family protein [Bryobacteraceae bacterium]